MQYECKITQPLFIRRSNLTLVLQPGATLQAKAGGFVGTNDCLLTIDPSENVLIRAHGATLKMQRPYLPPAYKKAEWRNVLSILGATNFTMDGGTLADSGGDGVMVAGASHGRSPAGLNYSQSITLRDLIVTRAWRNGLSVISAKGLVVQNCTFQQTSGTNPQFGIDLEPDASPFGYLEGIVFRDIRLHDNLNG